ncbi:hypothetical protein SPRG_19222 [Saprolegnia parasitica CBS 223.65]|uniref:Uncharacterized protein n=1 Tax=Saprolegnia parasitica (strain CBS 223.65) TaxID=695850 RepID=A0A067CWG1_SAPPC|nr:hypothetical protein SPRG_19222 [Saprolegnia parasitica CBS 223.65]KDO33590.1 hypothetical protein SPRG_19222 [Saprolegnia parasitica CBS 223.65]|eukprot:XP_012195642.1 hypothetical protein SPRG_19222 [Saprolegnia parasitica CBS 223.65]
MKLTTTLTGRDLLQSLQWFYDQSPPTTGSNSPIVASPVRRRRGSTVTQDQLHAVRLKIEAHQESARDAGVLNTIAWLRAHDDEQTAPKATGFLTSVLQFLHVTDEPAMNTVDSSSDTTWRLPRHWAEHSLRVQWNELGYRLLNASFYVDMMQARKIILSGELLYATSDECKAFATWLDGFFVHIELLQQLKQRFLRLKSATCNRQLTVSTQYGRANSLYNESIRFMHAKPIALYGEKVLEFLNELEMTLWDEEEAIADVNRHVTNADDERLAIARLFADLSVTEPAGVVVAKLVAWMPQALDATDVRAFVQLFGDDVQSCISGVWLRAYAQHLHLLEAFEVDLSATTAYSRSRVDVSPLHPSIP